MEQEAMGHDIQTESEMPKITHDIKGKSISIGRNRTNLNKKRKKGNIRTHHVTKGKSGFKKALKKGKKAPSMGRIRIESPFTVKRREREERFHARREREERFHALLKESGLFEELSRQDTYYDLYTMPDHNHQICIDKKKGGSIESEEEAIAKWMEGFLPETPPTSPGEDEDLFAIATDQPFRFPSTFTFVLRAFSTLQGDISLSRARSVKNEQKITKIIISQYLEGSIN